MSTAPDTEPTEQDAAAALDTLSLDLNSISTLIDASYPRDLDREAWLWRRITKVDEEVGEVQAALRGFLGENPRKGQTHTWQDVNDELMDVAIAALGAWCHANPLRDPLVPLAQRAAFVHERLTVANALLEAEKRVLADEMRAHE